MHDINETDSSMKWFPRARLDDDFPMALWLAGLWFYLKSFLYLCYLYMLGLDPTPYSTPAKVEIAYFAVAFVPSLLLGMALWNRREQVSPLSVHLKSALALGSSREVADRVPRSPIRLEVGLEKKPTTP